MIASAAAIAGRVRGPDRRAVDATAPCTRAARASTWPRPETGRWCCCCTASRSSGGPGGTSSSSLAEAGYRAVAVDLRGYGASDKPPRGYDLPTLAADAAGLIRALGETGRDRRRARLGRPAGLDDGGAATPRWCAAWSRCRRRTRCGCARPLLTDPLGQLGRAATRSASSSRCCPSAG